MLTISVIIPTYKPQQYLDACLESLEKQTASKGIYEVLVVLNGEKEPYYSAIQKKLDSCSFSSQLLHTPVQGVSNARNIGLTHAKGKHIAFVDDDDYVSPSYLDGLCKLALENPSAIIVSNVLTVTEDGMTFGKDYISNAFERFSIHPSDSLFKKRKFLSSSCCKLIPMSIIKDRRFNTKLRQREDAMFMFELSDEIQDIVLADKGCIYYRRLRTQSASRKSQSLMQKLRTKTRLIAIICGIYQKHFLHYNFFLFLSRVVAFLIAPPVK